LIKKNTLGGRKREGWRRRERGIEGEGGAKKS
jgi:hypothetical protein